MIERLENVKIIVPQTVEAVHVVYDAIQNLYVQYQQATEQYGYTEDFTTFIEDARNVSLVGLKYEQH